MRDFPFPSPPDLIALRAGIKLLSDLGCLNLYSDAGENDGNFDGIITNLGKGVAKLPLGVRYAKMLIVGAGAGILNYSIMLVAMLSEQSPFLLKGGVVGGGDEEEEEKEEENNDNEEEHLDEVDKEALRLQKEDLEAEKNIAQRWKHSGGDAVARLLAGGAFNYAGNDCGGAAQQLANKTFCSENGLNLVVMQRTQKLCAQLEKLCVARFNLDTGAGGDVRCRDLPPPSSGEEEMMRQVVTSGMLDHVARRAVGGEVVDERGNIRRNAYICSHIGVKGEPKKYGQAASVSVLNFLTPPQISYIQSPSLSSATARSLPKTTKNFPILWFTTRSCGRRNRATIRRS